VAVGDRVAQHHRDGRPQLGELGVAGRHVGHRLLVVGELLRIVLAQARRRLRELLDLRARVREAALLLADALRDVLDLAALAAAPATLRSPRTVLWS
jgi:hypothetical protein